MLTDSSRCAAADVTEAGRLKAEAQGHRDGGLELVARRRRGSAMPMWSGTTATPAALGLSLLLNVYFLGASFVEAEGYLEEGGLRAPRRRGPSPSPGPRSRRSRPA